MKFKVAVIGILTAILATNIIGMIITTSEAKAQTEIALKTAKLISIQTNIIHNEANTDQETYFWEFNKLAEINDSLWLEPYGILK